MALTWEESNQQGVVLAVLRGEFDLQASRDLEPIFNRHLDQQTPALLLDFHEVAFIDSSGIASLITYFREARDFGGKLALARVSAPIQNVFNLVSLGTFFPLFEDIPIALAALVGKTDS